MLSEKIETNATAGTAPNDFMKTELKFFHKIFSNYCRIPKITVQKAVLKSDPFIISLSKKFVETFGTKIRALKVCVHSYYLTNKNVLKMF